MAPPVIYYDDYLEHHGIKGQKWGVRRTPEQLGHVKKKTYDDDAVIKKGTEFRRISANPDDYKNPNIYVSFKIEDADVYRGIFGRYLLEKELEKEGSKIYEEILTSNKDLKIAGRTAGKAAFDKVLKEHLYDALDVIDTLDNEEEVGKTVDLYDAFNTALTNSKSIGPNAAIDSFYKSLKDAGYDAIVDENDTRNGYKAKSAMIVFDSVNNFKDVKLEELSSGDIYQAHERALNSQKARETRVDLSPDSKKEIKSYRNQAKEDKDSLNLTTDELSKVWGAMQTYDVNEAEAVKEISDLVANGTDFSTAFKEVLQKRR